MHGLQSDPSSVLFSSRHENGFQDCCGKASAGLYLHYLFYPRPDFLRFVHTGCFALQRHAAPRRNAFGVNAPLRLSVIRCAAQTEANVCCTLFTGNT